jgi:hypothetical protein
MIFITGGRERYRIITKYYYRGADGAMLVYDITNKTSFKNMKWWLNEVRQHADRDIVILVVGNKSGINQHCSRYFFFLFLVYLSFCLKQRFESYERSYNGESTKILRREWTFVRGNFRQRQHWC